MKRAIPCRGAAERGIALLAVLMAMTLLLLLALPFALSMSRGADAAVNEVEARQAEMLSASVRDLLLAQAAYGHPTYDPTPGYDDRSEWPDRVPDVFPALRLGGRARFGGEVVDLQRFVALDALTPLLLGNLLGTSTRLRQVLAPEADALQVEDAAALPDAGFVWCDHEVIHYGHKQGNALTDLERGLLRERGFAAATDHTVVEQALVLDFRCVVACAWPFDGRTDGACRQRHPFHAPGELAEIERAGFGGFTAAEMDVLQAALTGDQEPATAPVWGRPERVFRELKATLSRTLTVKSALSLGAGSTVRIRNLETGAAEYGLVMSTRTPRAVRDLLLPSEFELDLLTPVTQDFPALDTVVEPLLPTPVNVNTADVRVLAALCAGIRRGHDVRAHDADGRQRTQQMLPIEAGEARTLAEAVVALREGRMEGAGDQQGPFAGFREFAERVFAPRFTAATSPTEKQRWIYLYRALLNGRDSAVEMGTAPVCFASGPRVAYRAAASLLRSSAATGIAARHERSGHAVALPGLRLLAPWQTQEQLEEAFRLDQRASYWNTAPVNLSAVGIEDAGNDPSSRYVAHVVGLAFPQFGLGEPRFPSRDLAEAAFEPAPSTVPPGGWSREERHHESFATENDPRGFDVGRLGPFLIRNTGPKDRGGAPPPASRSHQITHGFTTQGGVMDRCALGFWVEPESLATQTLLDYSDGDRERNRCVLQARDGQLVFEVVDEAGLDPDPAQSPAGVPRTAAQWRLPLADLALPPRTPLHCSVSAYGNRPGDLSVAFDGLPRGKALYRTFLTAPVPVYDPQQSPAGPPGQSTRDPRYIELQVESTEGFPPQGLLRIGLEMFEYTEITGNSFVCVFRDSMGGRGARQLAIEHRPSIPMGTDGRPAIDITQLQQQGVSLDLFPDHPVGSAVELCGYSGLISPHVVLNVRETALAGPLGAFAVARGFVQNGRPITIQSPRNQPIQVGTGIDETWNGVLELADPVPTGRRQPPAAAQQPILDAFPAGGGYALLVQRRMNPYTDLPGQIQGLPTEVGGVELIRYAARQGSRLTGVQRAAPLNGGDDAQIASTYYDGRPHRFVTDWEDWAWGNAQPPVIWDEVPTLILWVVPVSLAVQDARTLANPAATGTSEWVQLYPRGNAVDTEWVRYDTVADNYLVRGNRARWNALRFALTTQTQVDSIGIGQLGPNGGMDPRLATLQPWGTLTATSGYIGYVPRLEADFPQIHAARAALAFRGDPFTNTSSHPHSNSSVLPCHRFVLSWGNHGALTARPGRSDRVALVQGSTASGTNRPAVEWHTVNWACRRYSGDVAARGERPTERLGPEPFQLCAFQEPVRQLFVGPERAPGKVDVNQSDMRFFDRIVKFPSGELPAAWCEAVTVGGAAGGGEAIKGKVDEIDVTDHVASDVLVDEAFTADARQFRANPLALVAAQGPLFTGGDLTADFPAGGGLVQIDQEILAYRSRADGTFQLAANGRGLLGTEPRAHDRGAVVHFLTHRPAAILTAAVQPRSNDLPLQALGALPPRCGTALLARTELLHYTWARIQGDQVTLEMPRQFPPGEDGDGLGPRGLFRGRYGTAPVAAGAGEPLIAMPFRYWDRHVERSDDPEQSYFQLTMREAPVFFRTLEWQEETPDVHVDVACLVRADARADWTADADKEPFLWRFERDEGGAPAVLGVQATELEVRFCSIYRPGSVDVTTGRAHAWKTAPRVHHVRLEYEGEGRILDERVTAR